MIACGEPGVVAEDDEREGVRDLEPSPPCEERSEDACVESDGCKGVFGQRYLALDAGTFCVLPWAFLECIEISESRACDEALTMFCTMPGTPEAEYVLMPNSCGPTGFERCDLPGRIAGDCES